MSELIRIKANRDVRYCTKYLGASEDKRLSWKAKGIHDYLISRPPEWEIHFSELVGRSTDGKAALRAGLQELEELGYLYIERHNAEHGKFKYIWNVFEKPQVKPSTENQCMAEVFAQVEPDAGLPYTVEPSTANRNIIKKHNSKEHKEENIKYIHGEFVGLTTKEYEALLEKYGVAFTERCIEVLDNYIGAKPASRKYTSHYRAILSWVVNKVKAEEPTLAAGKTVGSDELRRKLEYWETVKKHPASPEETEKANERISILKALINQADMQLPKGAKSPAETKLGSLNKV